jgi:AraC-like DNA-binding protein/tetratricopeptide (TPR) repeat protein/predicted Ser/Thr protein kinase
MRLEGTTLNGRYRVESTLGSGGMGTVYLARDLREGGNTVAVKVLDSSRTSHRIEDIIRFRAEAGAAAGLDHPNIVKVLDLGTLETGYHYPLHYIVMEYLEGRTLQDILAGPDTMELDAAVALVSQVCAALEAVHARGIIHRDIKPGNVILSGERAVLIDFGLARIKEYDREESRSAAGSFHYIAPEQIRLTRGDIDERSDLYSLGVLFYRLVSGRLPFEGDDINSLIHRHIAMRPPAPSSLRDGVPPVIDSIILRLLEKEPENRYQSARGLAADLKKYQEGHREFMPGLGDRSAKLSYKTRLVGREGELFTLTSLLDCAKRGRGGICFVAGLAGLGKSRLVDEFKKQVYSAGGVFIAGKCFQGHAKMPYGAVSEALGEYYRHFRSLPALTRERISSGVKAGTGELGEIILKINPLMGELLGECRPLVELKSNRESQRFQMVASRFLGDLAAATGFLVVILDDIQWLDNGSFDLLAELINDVGNMPLLVVATYRKDEADANPAAEKLMERALGSPGIASLIELHPLDDRRMREFVSGILLEESPAVDRIASLVSTKSKGNPFHAIEIIKQLEGAGAIRYDESWSIDQGVLDRTEVPASIVDTVLKRMSLLDDGERSVLAYAAILGKRFDMPLLFRLCGGGAGSPALDEADTVRIVDKAIELQILERSPADPRTHQFVHDRILEAFYGMIPPARRKKLHDAIGADLEAQGTTGGERAVYDLAYHYIMSGNREKILSFAMPAALKAKEQYANEVAIRYLYIIIHLIEETPGLMERDGMRALWIRAVENLGEVYHTIGEYDRAIGLFNSILGYKERVEDRAGLYKQISRAYFKKGDWANCERYGKKGLELLGERLPTSVPAVILSIAREALAQVFYPLGKIIGLAARGNRDRYERVSWIYLDLGWSYILSDVRKFLRTALRMINIARYRIGASTVLGMAYAIFGSLWMSIGLFRMANRSYEKSLRLRETFNDQWGRGQTLQWLGYSLEWGADFPESLKKFTLGYDIFRGIGDVREMGMCLAGKIHDYTFIADYESAAAALDEYLDISTRTGDDYGISESWTYRTWYCVETGDLDRAGECGLKAFNYSLEKNILFTHCRSSIELGYCYLEKGDYARAVHYLGHARELNESGNYLKPFTVHLYGHLAEALMGELESGSPAGAPAPAKKLKEIRRLCAKALGESARWRAHRPAALRAAARCAALGGKSARARRLFARAIDEAERMGRRFEAAKTKFYYASYLLRGSGASRAMEYLEESYAACVEMGAELYRTRIAALLGIGDGDSPSLARVIGREKLASIIKLSNELTSISDMESLLDRVISCAMEVTGAQRAFLFLVDEKTGGLELRMSKNISPGGGPDYSKSIIDEVLSTGRRMIIANAAVDGALQDSRSVVVRDLKSILCTPLKLGGRTFGVFYLDNPLASGVFSREEARLIDILFSQTALAVKNLNREESSGTSGRKQAASPAQEEKIDAVIAFIDLNFTSDITRESLAEQFDMNPDYLGKLFKSARGRKIGDYITELRVSEAADKIRNTDAHIIDIAYSVGFESLRTFNRAFQKIMTLAPTEYRDREAVTGHTATTEAQRHGGKRPR